MIDTRRCGSSQWLTLLGLLAVAALAWVLFGGDEDPNGPLDPTQSTQVSSTDGPTAAEVGELPEVEQERSSTLVRATLTVLLSKPAWAQLPETCEVVLTPLEDELGEVRRARTEIGGAIVEFHDLLFGRYRVDVEALGFAPAGAELRVSRENHAPRRVLAMQPARAITGEVRDLRGEPIVGVEVTARPAEPIPGYIQTRGVAVTDEQGRYSITSIPEGDWWVHVGPLRSPLNDPVRIEVYGERVYQDLKIPALGAMELTITQDPDGNPLAGARVQVVRVGDDGARGHSEYRSTDSRGQVRFGHLPPGEYAVTVLAPGHKSRTQHYMVEPGADGKVELAVTAL